MKMMMNSVFSKYARVHVRSARNFSPGRDFSSLSHPPSKDTSLGMPGLFIATFIGGTLVYCVTDIVKYIKHSRRITKLQEECRVLHQRSHEKTERMLGVKSIFQQKS